MSIIKDGKGTGRTLHINSENKAEVTSVSQPIDQHVNDTYQKVFSLPFDGIDPAGADDYFVHINNTGIKNLRITDIRLKSTVAGTVEIHKVIGTASYASDTDITPVNRFLGSTNLPVAVIKTDTNTTGITNDGVLFYINCDTVNATNHVRTSSNIIIPPGQQIALLWDTGTGVLSGVISLVEDE